MNLSVRVFIVKRLILVVGVLAPLISFFACQSESDDLLRGKWQVKYEVRLDRTRLVDTVFYNFDGEVLSIQAVFDRETCHNVYGRFELRNDSLLMQFVDLNQQNSLHDNKFFGWNSTDTVRIFRIKELTHDQLVIEDAQSELILKKF